MSEASRSRILQAVSTLETGLGAVKNAAGALSREPPPAEGDLAAPSDLRQLLSEAAERIHMQATSVGMLWGDENRQPKEDEADSILGKYEQAILHYCALCHGVLAGAGTTLAHAVMDNGSAVVESSITLLQSLMDPSKQKQLASLAGMVWQACDRAKKAPVDNKTAMSRALTRTAKAAKDAVREVSELVEDSAKEADSDGGAAAADVQVFSDDEDLDFEADKLCLEEVAVAKCAIEVILAVIGGFKAVLQVWISGAFPETDRECLCTLEKALQSAAQCGIASEALAASLYGPQDPVEVGKAVDEVAEGWEALLVTLGSLPEYAGTVGQAGAHLLGTLSALRAACGKLDNAHTYHSSSNT